LKILSAKTAHQLGHAVAQHRVVVSGINQGRIENGGHVLLYQKINQAL
jgi:hypothetical protein